MISFYIQKWWSFFYYHCGRRANTVVASTHRRVHFSATVATEGKKAAATVEMDCSTNSGLSTLSTTWGGGTWDGGVVHPSQGVGHKRAWKIQALLLGWRRRGLYLIYNRWVTLWTFWTDIWLWAVMEEQNRYISTIFGTRCVTGFRPSGTLRCFQPAFSSITSRVSIGPMSTSRQGLTGSLTC